MAQAPLLLTSVTDCGKQEAAAVWDPIAGNQVASFSGEAAAMGTLTAVRNVIFSAVARKPIIQTWSFQSENYSLRRFTTKGPVTALAFTYDGFFMYLAIGNNIFVYQVCSGCLITVLEASHMAPIGALTVSQRHPSIPLPFLLSADTSGLVACWPALVSGDDLVSTGNGDFDNNGDIGSKPDPLHKPLWYVVQASRGLPVCTFVADDRIVACAGTDGVKFFNSETGTPLCSVLEQSPTILCICALPQDDKFVFSGTDNGILHSVWLRDPENSSSYEVSFRRCFVDSELSSTEKAICCVCASPVDSGFPLLAVSTRTGLVEVLRQDTCLVRLRRFSVAPSLLSNSGSPRVTGFLMLTRPTWLLETQPPIGVTETNDLSIESTTDGVLGSLHPLKRHLGWHADDLLYLQLPNLKRERMSDKYLDSIYQDDFLQTKGVETLYLPLGSCACGTNSKFNESANTALKEKKEALEKRNGELMRILVANCLSY